MKANEMSTAPNEPPNSSIPVPEEDFQESLYEALCRGEGRRVCIFFFVIEFYSNYICCQKCSFTVVLRFHIVDLNFNFSFFLHDNMVKFKRLNSSSEKKVK